MIKTKTITISTITVASIILVLGLGCPQYNVYYQRLEGEAMLAKSQAERQVQIQDAQSKQEAAKHLAGADIERAKGVAESNRIIGTSLQNNEAYLKWLYIEGLKERTGMQTVYIPTEAGLPILEAGKRRNKE